MRTRTAIAIIVGIISVMLMGYSSRGSAQVSVNIGVGLPIPQLVIPAPPPVVVIPGTYAYFAPDVEVDMFFYHGYWYRPHHGHWYRARGYNGPWNNIEGARVPRVLRHLPPDYRHSAQRHERIRYVEVEKNWKTWEQNKHWDRHDDRGKAPDNRDDGRWDGKQGRHGGKGKHDR
jgi:hypothetical protein